MRAAQLEVRRQARPHAARAMRACSRRASALIQVGLAVVVTGVACGIAATGGLNPHLVGHVVTVEASWIGARLICDQGDSGKCFGGRQLVITGSLSAQLNTAS